MRLFKFALPVLFATGLALLGARAWTDAADSAQHKLLQEHARLQFAERAAVARAAPDLEHYRNDLRALLRSWYADQADIGNRFPLLRGQAGAFVPPAPKVARGSLKEFQDLADQQASAWREGKVDLLETAAAQGLRLDLLRVTKLSAPQPHLAVDLAVWGAPEETETEEPTPGKVSQRVTVPLVFKGIQLKFLDAQGKMIARMEVPGEPALRLDVPERLAADAPPGVVLGRYEPALFPPGIAEVEWTLSAQVRSASGDSRLATAVFKTKAEPAWSGAAWDADKDKIVTETEGEARAAVGEAQVRPGEPHPQGRKAKQAVWPTRE